MLKIRGGAQLAPASPATQVEWLAPHGRHQHRHYQMSCADLEDLWARAEGRCEVCRAPSERTADGLNLDHDHGRGIWAVRGLLCTRCNTFLGNDKVVPADATAQYLSNPWVDQRHGPAVHARPEPGVGTSVRIGPRTWTRAELCWWPSGNYPWNGRVRTWGQMNYEYGPPHIKVLAEPFAGTPKWQVALVLERLEREARRAKHA